LINLWNDAEFRANNISRLTTNNPIKNSEVAAKGFIAHNEYRKSGVEINFEKICDGLPITYIGDGSSETIAHKIPDFIVNGQNKVIEIWAADASFAKDRDDNWIVNRKKLFKKHGYQTLFIPLTQIDLQGDNHQTICEKVSAFIHNGIIVTKVSEVTTNRAFARLYGSHTADHIVHNLEVADTHTYIANRCVVHNCDTYFDSGDWFTIEEIDAKIDKAINDYYKGTIPNWMQLTEIHKRKAVLVITGGEPMLQQNLVPFLQFMNTKFQNTQIESNGTIWQDIPLETTLVCSPKCSEKRGKAIKYLKPNEQVLDRADCLKFVMNADNDSPYSTIPDWAHEYAANNKKVFISPMNIYNREPQKSKLLRSNKNDISIEERSSVDEVISFWEEGLLNMPENQKNHEYAAKYCIEHGFILNLQIHLYASLA
jgi:organic radical activating enzyme